MIIGTSFVLTVSLDKLLGVVPLGIKCLFFLNSALIFVSIMSTCGLRVGRLDVFNIILFSHDRRIPSKGVLLFVSTSTFIRGDYGDVN